MKLGSLFDGIGGFPLVASWYGIEPVWASEIEAAPISITKRHFPNMKHLGDITKINGAEIEPVDIITFGSPCQDLSVAGKREGMAFTCNDCGQKWDYSTTYGVESECPKCGSEEISRTRSSLFTEAIRIIKEMREATNGLYPTWAIWENVTGALSSNDGMDFRAVLQSFADTEIPMPASGRWANAGMVRGGRCDVGWRILDAQFWGVPQRRKRIFLVADFGGQRAAEVLFKPESLRGHFAPGRTTRKGTSSDAGNGTPGAGGVVYDCRGNGDGRTAGTLVGDHQSRVTDYTAICIAGNIIGREPQHGGNQFGIHEEVAYTLTSADRHAVVAFTANDYGADVGDVSPSLRAGGHDKSHANGGVVPAVCFGIKSFGEYEQTEKGKTLLSSDDVTTGDLIATIDCRNFGENAELSGTLQSKGTGGYSLNYTNPVRIRQTVRRLTPVECERLQGFPDDWTRWGHDGKEISDSARYKAIGNSLALPCVEYIIRGIVDVSREVF